MILSEFNQLSKAEAGEGLFKCCGSRRWVDLVLAGFPFADERRIFDLARESWYEECVEADYLEAFGHHPKIGDLESLKKKFSDTKEWAGNEQAGVGSATDSIIQELSDWNERYLQKYGYIFIICATGKSAGEMLHLLKQRSNHHQSEELRVAMGEQFKITLIRLKKLLDLKESFWNEVSQVTTHVLDTSLGRPGKDLCIRLKKKVDKHWQTIAMGITNADGRIPDLLPAGVLLPADHFQMCFDTKGYFDLQEITGFYPRVDIDFQTFDQSHYHIPLLLNPFGYSTYRGS